MKNLKIPTRKGNVLEIKDVQINTKCLRILNLNRTEWARKEEQRQKYTKYISEFAKFRRLEWLGFLERMETSRNVKSIILEILIGEKSEQPRRRWTEVIVYQTTSSIKSWRGFIKKMHRKYICKKYSTSIIFTYGDIYKQITQCTKVIQYLRINLNWILLHWRRPQLIFFYIKTIEYLEN